jgi:hypothetical protein
MPTRVQARNAMIAGESNDYLVCLQSCSFWIICLVTRSEFEIELHPKRLPFEIRKVQRPGNADRPASGLNGP